MLTSIVININIKTDILSKAPHLPKLYFLPSEQKKKKNRIREKNTQATDDGPKTRK
jgi:hypothetical protein